ncbi:MAG: DUF2892 domain-containing protein [candidate division Zixibacteria bacterium]|nr:DUF2892 domain-containing protein [candidate division Zixibacteria bacterium]
MTRNVGSFDRTVRIILGLLLLSLIFWGPQSWWGLIGIMPLYTGVVGICLPYKLLGINTCKTRQQTSPSTKP